MSLLENRVLTLDQASTGTGPIGPVIDTQLSPRSDTYLTLDNNIRTKVDNSFVPIINAQDVSSQQYVNDKYVNFTGREQISPTVVEQTNLKGNDVFHNLSINDAKVTTNQTTNFSYSGNAQRETDGTNWWRYKDAPKVTTNQTTNFSYSGDVAGVVSSHNQMNRVLFTGTTKTYIDENGKTYEYNTGDSGVTNWSQKSTTLVENYYPGSNGNTNIQLDAEEKIGFTELRSDFDSINAYGSGSYQQAIPNAERFQQISPKIIGDVEYNPNKTQSVDNRQTANYLINNLQTNDFSIYQRPELRQTTNTPSFFIDENASDYSGISYQPLTLKKLEPHKLENGFTNVYENNKYNPNTVITNNTYGQSKSNVENPLLYQSKKPNNTAQFLGKGYPGTAINANVVSKNNQRILLDTDSKLSSQYLDYFSPS